MSGRRRGRRRAVAARAPSSTSDRTSTLPSGGSRTRISGAPAVPWRLLTRSYANRTRGERRKAEKVAATPSLDGGVQPGDPELPEGGVTFVEEEGFPRGEAKRRWAALIRLVSEVDPMVCPKCGNQLRVIARIQEPGVIDKILRHPRAPGRRRRGRRGGGERRGAVRARRWAERSGRRPGRGDAVDPRVGGLFAGGRGMELPIPPDAEDLAGIFRRIAADIPCPAEAFWPSRVSAGGTGF
jgi:hypothetical protein